MNVANIRSRTQTAILHYIYRKKRVKCSKSAAWLVALQAVMKPIPGYVRIACSGFMITGLLQVVNRFDTSWLWILLLIIVNSLMQIVLTPCAGLACKYQVASSLIFHRFDANWWTQQVLKAQYHLLSDVILRLCNNITVMYFDRYLSCFGINYFSKFI